MRFRTRLAAFLVATLAIVQVLTAVSVYVFTRQALISQGKNRLAAAATVFLRQLGDTSEHAAERVRILALDYALRVAIADNDHATVLSALRNHGRRIGATRMLLVDLNGSISADTAAPFLQASSFPFPDLLGAAVSEAAIAVVTTAGRSASWMIALPVLAPVPIAFIVAEIPIDDALLARLQEIASLPKDIELALDAGGRWSVIARGSGIASLVRYLPPPGAALDAEATINIPDGGEFLILAARIETAAPDSSMVAVLGYPLDETLKPYRPVLIAVIGLLALGLAAALAGAVLIARGVSRPVEVLAALARRLGAGNYAPPPRLPQHGEIGELSAAFNTMTRAIAEREEHIQHQATHDATTGLLNRAAMESLLRARFASRPAEPGALFWVGLTRLQEVIETVGHELGDRLLQDAGNRLKRSAATGVLARANDTSFAIWLAGADAASARALATRIVDVCQDPYREGDVAIDAAAAVGIALYPDHGAEADALARHADVALHAAVRAHDAVALYDPGADPHRPERLSLMSDLRGALARDELFLAYQPKLDLGAGRIGGAEALVRWNHAKRGFLPPASFISLAEETGNIRWLTRWVMAKAVAQAARWATRHLALGLSINLSVRDLGDADLPQRLLDFLAASSLSPDRITLEITESAIMADPDAAIAMLRRIADIGIDLAVDDFGVGQSSFAYLRRMPVRELKIDKTFVVRLAEDEEDRTIVRSIVELGHRLHCHVTAEGVEDEATLNFLTEVGCDYGQDYFLAPPLVAEAFDGFIEKARWPVKKLRTAS